MRSKAFETVPSPRGGLVPQTLVQAAPNWIMKHINRWSFYQISKCQAPLNKRNAPLLKTFWRWFWFETFIGTVCMPLCASVHPHRTYLVLFSFSLLAVYLKLLILECLHFSHTTGFLYYDGWITLQLGRW